MVVGWALSKHYLYVEYERRMNLIKDNICYISDQLIGRGVKIMK